jgi:hypothetical protein
MAANDSVDYEAALKALRGDPLARIAAALERIAAALEREAPPAEPRCDSYGKVRTAAKARLYRNAGLTS